MISGASERILEALGLFWGFILVDLCLTLIDFGRFWSCVFDFMGPLLILVDFGHRFWSMIFDLGLILIDLVAVFF